jgi:hypothetical protein
MAKITSDQYSEQENARRRDVVIKRMIATPPKLHSEMKLGKRSAKDGGESRWLKRKNLRTRANNRRPIDRSVPWTHCNGFLALFSVLHYLRLLFFAFAKA